MVVRATNWAFLGMLCAISVHAGQALAAQTLPTYSLPVAIDVRLGGDETQTRFVMDFSRKIDLRAFTLADPYRVVIDIPQVVFQLPPKTGDNGRGLIKAFRFGLVMQGGSRLVFDLAKPAKIEKAFVVDSTETAPARLVLELSPTDRPSFLRRAATDNHTARADMPARPCAGGKGQRSTPAGRARSRARRSRYRHQGVERGRGEGYRLDVRAAAARTSGEIRQVPGAAHAQRRYLRGARRPREDCTRRRRHPAGVDPCQLAAARRRRCAGGQHLHVVGHGHRFRSGASRREGKQSRRDRRR